MLKQCIILPVLWAFIISPILLTGCAAPSLTVPQIIDMSQAGDSDQVICDKIADSGSIYRLKASQITELSEIGVSNQVIDCMRQTYIDAVRQDQTLEDWDNWTMNEDGYWYW